MGLYRILSGKLWIFRIGGAQRRPPTKKQQHRAGATIIRAEILAGRLEM